MRDGHNRTDYWWDPHVPGLSLLRADFTRHDFAAHTHDAFVIALTEAGGARFASRGLIGAMAPATLFVSNPEEPQAAWMGDNPRWRYRSIYLTRRAIDVVARALGVEHVPYFTRNLFADGDLIARFARLHRALQHRRGPGGRDDFRTHELLIGTLGTLFARHGSGAARIAAAPRDRALVDRAVALMRAHCDADLRLDALAHATGLTSFQLIGLFKRTVGLTPHAYLVDIRLGRACRELRLGRPLADSALAAGFYDQSALTRHFKRRYGITPRQFAAAARSRNFSQDAGRRGG
jgi:AraC-like DNA-binding protein